jgi:RND superfamily putative drug exporter
MLVVAGLIVAAAIGLMVSKVATLSASGGFDDPSSASSRAVGVLSGPLHSAPPQIVIVLTPAAGSVDSTAGADAGNEFTTRLTSQVAQLSGGSVQSYWSTGRPAPLRSRSGRSALVVATLDPNPDTAVKDLDRLKPQIVADAAAVHATALIGGESAVNSDIGKAVASGLLRAESISVPITAILLILIFGSAIASFLPLGVGIVSVLGTFGVLRLIALFASVSSYSQNLAISMGLGLGIDYSLFIVTRYREEVQAGHDRTEAIAISLRTAGRTVAFSAATVTAALAVLMIFPLYFLRSFGYAGMSATIIAALGALTLLPALLMLLGDRVDSADLRKPIRRLFRRSDPVSRVPDPATGVWYRTARAAIKQPVLLGGAALAIFILLGLPLRHAQFGLPDDRVLQTSSSSHAAQQALRDEFSAGFSRPVYVVSAEATPAERTSDAATAYAEKLSADPAVAAVSSVNGEFVGGQQLQKGGPATARYAASSTGTWLQVVPKVDPESNAGGALVQRLRALPAPFPGVLVGGEAAQLDDTRHAVGSRLPIAGGLVGAITLLVLFLFTGSVLLPLKALVLNAVSVGSTLGILVWAFQEGHLAGALHFQHTGLLDLSMPVLMFCVLFGLSMDYEVFVLSRIKERHDLGQPDSEAIALGLGATGRLISAAAALLAIVFAAFVTNGVTFIKMLGFGSAIAVLLDATVVRAILVPAAMRLAGRANWWAPGPLRRLHAKLQLSEG